MQIVRQMLYSMLSVLQIDFSIWGHTLSLWKVFGFSFISIVMSKFIWGVIDGD